MKNENSVNIINYEILFFVERERDGVSTESQIPNCENSLPQNDRRLSADSLAEKI